MDKNLSSILAASVFGILVLVSQSAKADLSCIGFKSQADCEYKLLVDKVGGKAVDNKVAVEQYNRSKNGQSAPNPNDNIFKNSTLNVTVTPVVPKSPIDNRTPAGR